MRWRARRTKPARVSGDPRHADARSESVHPRDADRQRTAKRMHWSGGDREKNCERLTGDDVDGGIHGAGAELRLGGAGRGHVRVTCVTSKVRVGGT